MAQAVQKVKHLLRAHRLGQGQRTTHKGLPDRRHHLPPKDGHDHPCREQKPVAHGLPVSIRSQPTAGDQTMEMWMQHQGLTPGMQRREDARLRPKILGVRQQGPQGVADRLKQQRRHHRDVGQPQRVELMGEGKDDMVMVTRQQPRLLESQPALGLEVGTLRTRPMPTGVVPDAGHMAIGTRLHMAA
jgi:hypothetical protein